MSSPEETEPSVNRRQQVPPLDDADVKVVQDQKRGQKTHADRQRQTEEDGKAALRRLRRQTPQEKGGGKDADANTDAHGDDEDRTEQGVRAAS